MDFSEAWREILKYAKSHQFVETLAKNNRNDIISADNNEIIVISYEPLNKPTRRTLERKYFQLVWNILEIRGSVSSKDITVLSGRRMVILALIARALSLRHTTRPVRIYLRS